MWLILLSLIVTAYAKPQFDALSLAANVLTRFNRQPDISPTFTDIKKPLEADLMSQMLPNLLKYAMSWVKNDGGNQVPVASSSNRLAAVRITTSTMYVTSTVTETVLHPYLQKLNEQLVACLSAADETTQA